MITYFQQYKPFLLFLGKFFLSYLVLTVLYQSYLATFGDDVVDGITSNVAFLTQKIANLFKIDISTQLDVLQFQIRYHGKYLARIIEGCNAISVIILFIAFIVAFSGKLKVTLLYIFVGSVMIYIFNIFRIIFLTILVYHFPHQEHLLHGVLFPLIIYGIVFLLWFIWVNKFSGYVSK
ncbi:exosortase family protein XrtF [Flavobacterium amnicola]|uniref:Exosortase family protein XrtF n=1 Tax=Flavobacterium amnicola TaxID=2506422 RepID=A0A4Q1K7Y7_9FLAO|nr:exosortase family protein XrtF [Flavobacterium amnicola]